MIGLPAQPTDSDTKVFRFFEKNKTKFNLKNFLKRRKYVVKYNQITYIFSCATLYTILFVYLIFSCGKQLSMS